MGTGRISSELEKTKHVVATTAAVGTHPTGMHSFTYLVSTHVVCERPSAMQGLSEFGMAIFFRSIFSTPKYGNTNGLYLSLVIPTRPNE